MSDNKFGILVYDDSRDFYNVGDYVQSLAAQGFFGKADVFINRERSAEYKGEPVKMIMNGWYTHTRTDGWIPSEKINPLFVSFHLNNAAKESMLNDKGIKFLKKHAPIGCRDQNTVKELKAVGVDAYFTGCLTLTLDRYKKENVEREKIYIVDPLYNYPQKDYIMSHYKPLLKAVLNGNIFKFNKTNQHLTNIFTKELLEKAEYIKQHLPGKGVSYEQRFKLADELLEKYSKAKLVITSRIHCALPCLAMGTPVIYVNGFDDFADTCRFDGILDLFNRVDVDSKTGEFSTNFEFDGEKISESVKIKNKEKYLELADALKKTCSDFVGV
ncbi:polysaccharide pyruvyl transferase family protein [Acinetobacter calcoaceticus]|uniref:polysaccharide pyruvyl transferase family protein n=1 Tax=Acinetobacter calcoaceticus TaxID=471 RepID=UPI0032B3F6A3